MSLWSVWINTRSLFARSNLATRSLNAPSYSCTKASAALPCGKALQRASPRGAPVGVSLLTTGPVRRNELRTSIPSGTIDFENEECELLAKLMARLAVERPILFGHSDGATLALIAAMDLGSAVVAEAPHVVIEPAMLAGIERACDAWETQSLRNRIASYHDGNVDFVFHRWVASWRRYASMDWSITETLQRLTVPVFASARRPRPLRIRGLSRTDRSALPRPGQDHAAAGLRSCPPHGTAGDSPRTDTAVPRGPRRVTLPSARRPAGRPHRLSGLHYRFATPISCSSFAGSALSAALAPS